MRGMDERSGLLFSYVDLEGRVRGSHPLRAIRLIVNEALSVLTARFEALYSPFGRLSDGQRSLFHLAMTAATLDVEARIAADPAAVGFHADGVPLPALTLIAVEEPENNLAPFYLSRRANRDFLVGAKRPSPASP
jgi:hypothetical protein